jgi:hypothetical protein
MGAHPLHHQPAFAERRRVAEQQVRIRGQQQQLLVDAEVRATRQRILTDFRQRLRDDPYALADTQFLATADRPVILRAIIIAATIVGGADASDLQIYDPPTGSLRIVEQRGFNAAFLDYFASVDATVPSACGIALATGEPVLIDDITRSPIFVGQPTLGVVLAAGTRAVRSYPLHAGDGRTLGVLSLHYREPRPRRGRPDAVAWGAACALASLPTDAVR